MAARGSGGSKTGKSKSKGGANNSSGVSSGVKFLVQKCSLYSLEQLHRLLLHMFERRKYTLDFAVNIKNFAIQHRVDMADAWNDFYSEPTVEFQTIGEVPFISDDLFQDDENAEEKQEIETQEVESSKPKSKNKQGQLKVAKQKMSKKELVSLNPNLITSLPTSSGKGKRKTRIVRTQVFITAHEKPEHAKHSVAVLVEPSGETIGKPDIGPYLDFCETHGIRHLLLVLAKDVTSEAKLILKNSSLYCWETWHIDDPHMDLEHPPDEPDSTGRNQIVPHVDIEPIETHAQLLKKLFIETPEQLGLMYTQDGLGRYYAVPDGSIVRFSPISGFVPRYRFVKAASIKGFSYGYPKPKPLLSLLSLPNDVV
jgi:DNA-directed RNA polymerase subunit H (RpoH/RPB5)